MPRLPPVSRPFDSTLDPMRVLASPAFKNRWTNPYNASLYTELEHGGTVVGEFTKQRLLRERWDIVHLHWPDGVLNSRHAPIAAARVAYLVAQLLFAKARGAKIVWTVHNLQAHNTSYPRVERGLWRAFVPLVDAAISLSHSGLEMACQCFPALARKAHFVVPHGHYRGCYKNECSRTEARTCLGVPLDTPVIGFVGQIKPYKNVPALLRAFLDRPAGTSPASLLIAGKPGDAALAAELAALAAGHPDVALRFGHIADDEMQVMLNACDLAVIPYREILNSGSAILALSFNRPVLVPAKGAMAELRNLVGPEWVMTYEGELDGTVLRNALRWATGTARHTTCNLNGLGWGTIAAQTLAAYQSVAAPHAIPSYPNPAESCSL